MKTQIQDQQLPSQNKPCNNNYPENKITHTNFLSHTQTHFSAHLDQITYNLKINYNVYTITVYNYHHKYWRNLCQSQGRFTEKKNYHSQNERERN